MLSKNDKRFLVFILYPATPCETLYNAEQKVVSESYVRQVAESYSGNDLSEYVDDDGLEVRKYGRIVFREFAE